MKRYVIVDEKQIKVLRLKLRNRQDKKEKRFFDVAEGDMVSILYIDSLEDLGDKKEYVLHGRVVNILVCDRPRCEVCKKAKYHYQIILDVSDTYGSKFVKLDLHKILDIHKYRYDYDLEENPELIPRKIMDDFFVHETWDDQKFSVGAGENDPLLVDKDTWEEDKEDE